MFSTTSGKKLICSVLVKCFFGLFASKTYVDNYVRFVREFMDKIQLNSI